MRSLNTFEMKKKRVLFKTSILQYFIRKPDFIVVNYCNAYCVVNALSTCMSLLTIELLHLLLLSKILACVHYRCVLKIQIV